LYHALTTEVREKVKVTVCSGKGASYKKRKVKRYILDVRFKTPNFCTINEIVCWLAADIPESFFVFEIKIYTDLNNRKLFIPVQDIKTKRWWLHYGPVTSKYGESPNIQMYKNPIPPIKKHFTLLSEIFNSHISAYTLYTQRICIWTQSLKQYPPSTNVSALLNKSSKTPN